MKMTIKAESVKTVMRKLEKDAKAAQKVLKATGSDMKRRVPGKVADDVRTMYNIPKADIMPAKKGDAVRRAGTIRVKGTTVSKVALVYTGHLLSVARFSMTPSAFELPKSQKGIPVKKRRRVKAKIKKQGGKKMPSSHAFLLPTGAREEGGKKKIKAIPFVRTTKKPYPIKPVKTLSVPQMIDNEKVHKTIETDINTMLETRLKHNLNRFMKR